jgi:hypothetical protein
MLHLLSTGTTFQLPVRHHPIGQQQGDFVTLHLKDLLPAITKHLHSMPHSLKPR